jgi:hypothetical protein
MNRTAGTITLVQEERFQLACDDGVRRLFILAHDAPLEADELERLERDATRVVVEYDEPAGVLAHTAHRLRKESPDETPRRH